ncbi:YcbK family protein [Thorsellia anophelis]|uniref:Murein endopeptidase K n=1 Tax=Thorsellia anophelis DSM 18579 TaxID=1123402 RepID=A0A1H9ZCT7_9GAMM|nr:YcbK family protein [Thorsellia anophelis]SES78639.1 Uncharacterized conserved protein YcbK, DUF882 family [Thorsellia anophelis DSM 18579]
MTKTINTERRKWLTLGALTLGATALLPKKSLAIVSTDRPQSLMIKNINTGESLKFEMFPQQHVDQHQLSDLSYLFRDHRSEKTKTIDPGLFDQLFRLQVLLGVQKPILLISGYRAKETNNSMRGKKRGVAKDSYHTKAQAMDFRIEGVQLSNIRNAMLKIKAGGVGYYAKSNFVHIDTGPVRTW